MIKQEFFKKEEKRVYVPPVHTPIAIPHKQKDIVSITEKIVLSSGDSFNTDNIDDQKKSAAFIFAQNQCFNRQYNKPTWLYKRSKNLEETDFTELYISQGIKSDSSRCFYALDGNKTVVCFILKAFKVNDYLVAWDTQSQQTYSILDPFCVSSLTAQQVRERFSKHPKFEEFISMKGHEAW